LERIPTIGKWPKWHGEWPPGKIAHAVGEAALVDEPPANEVGRGAATTDAEVKRREAAESPSAPATAPTNEGREAAATTKDMATAAAAGVRGGPSPLEPTSDAGREAAVVTYIYIYTTSSKKFYMFAVNLLKRTLKMCRWS
jgi:hypothetical protein